MKTTIIEKQRGLLFRNGKFVKMLEPGIYRTYGNKYIEAVELENTLVSKFCSLDVLLRNKAISSNTIVTEVADQQLALHFVNGNFKECLKTGKYAFWTVFDKHEFTLVDISTPEVSSNVPVYIFSKIPQQLYTKIEVAEYMKARLYFNNKLMRLLDAGTYYFWNTNININFSYVDTRLTQMEITGQEILSLDKVALRINFVCNYRITDFVKVFTEIDNYKEQMHVAAQLALREYVGKYRIDEILENKEQISAYVLGKLKEKEKQLFVEITDAGVKDIILPGEIRNIMNTVLIAEKRAQANVITRREEVASTRSLLNTAKLMDENNTLYKLKELEYLERICERVNSINVNGNNDLLTQLNTIMHGKNAD